MPGFSVLFHLIRCLIAPRLRLAAEILALRQQLIVLNRSVKRPQLHDRDRFFWAMLSKLWKDWREVLVIVKPDTVVKWHRQGFKLFWKWKSKSCRAGRPKIDQGIRELIRKMSRENPLWGVPRIQAELRRGHCQCSNSRSFRAGIASCAEGDRPRPCRLFL